MVITNDPKTPQYKLKISGKVEEFASIKPRYVRFEGNPEKIQKTIVTIIPRKKYPFRINNTRMNNGKWIQHTIEPWETGGQKGYKLIIKNLKKGPGVYRDSIILDTDSPVQPEIRINVFAKLNTGQKNQPKDPNKQKFIELIKKLQKEHQQKQEKLSK